MSILDANGHLIADVYRGLGDEVMNILNNHDRLKSLLDECRQALDEARKYYPEGLAKQSVNTLLDKIGGVV